MALWPFGRKNRKPDPLAEKTTVRSKPAKGQQLARPAVRHGGRAAPSGEAEGPPEKQRSVTSPAPVVAHNVQRRGRAHTASPVPSLPVQQPASPATPERFPQRKRSTSEVAPAQQPRSPSVLKKPNPYYTHHLASQSSLQADHLSVMALPTLRNSRSVQENRPSRHKSSKKKEEQRLRALEVKAMSTPLPIPKRPQSIGAGLLARDSKRVPGGLNRTLERPLSEISLPMAESLRSSLSDPPVMHSFKISALGALSPRPTIKYAERPRWQTLSPHSARKEKGPIVPDEDFHARKRIDDLADDLDANGLRQLLERDQRRRERKRRSHQAEFQRKLGDRMEQEVAAEMRRTHSAQALRPERASEPPPSPERQRTADRERPDDTEPPDGEREADTEPEHELDLPMDQAPSPALRDSPLPPRGPVRKPSWLDDPSKEHLPLNDPSDDHVAESFLEDATSADDREEPVVQTATAVRLSQASMSPPTSPIHTHARGSSNMSTYLNLDTVRVRDVPERPPPETAEPHVKPGDARRDSDMSGRLAGSWTSFFRRSGVGKNKRHSTENDRTPPPPMPPATTDFANASRDSLARPPVPPPIPARSFRRSGAKTTRTHSRFKEDLPELPLSPPASRMQSPDLGGRSSPYIDQSTTVSALRTGGLAHAAPLSDVHPAYRDEVARSRGHSLRGTSPDVPSPNVLSQSLASVDSEGSWLSGKPSHQRSSVHANPLHSSAGSLSQHLRDSMSAEDHSCAASRTDARTDDAYFARRDPAGTVRAAPSGLTSQLHADDLDAVPHGDDHEDDDDDDDDESRVLDEPRSVPEPFTLNTVVGRHPTIVRRKQLRAQSREGLLDDFHHADTPDHESPVSPLSPASLTSPVSIASPDSPTDAAELPIQGHGDGAGVHRATSVEYGGKGGHARHMSAGSARLLDLTPRSSREQKRLSGASLGRSLLGRGGDEGATTRSASVASEMEAGVVEEAGEGT